MRTIYHYAIICVLATLWSCTHNEGDIGPYFGTWALVEATGEHTVPGDDRGVFLQFQGGTACVRVVFNELHSYDAAFGNWHDSGGVLTLDFPDHTAQNWDFSPYGVELHNEWRVTWSDGNRRLTLGDSGGTMVFKKVP